MPPQKSKSEDVIRNREGRGSRAQPPKAGGRSAVGGSFSRSQMPCRSSDNSPPFTPITGCKRDFGSNARAVSVIDLGV